VTPKKIYIIAGEASGDLHGSNLIRALRAETKIPLTIYGVGGDRIKETGALDFFDLAHFHVTGITDALKKYPLYRKAAATILENIRNARPDLVVLIDNPGFNLHLAQKIHTLGIPIVYYIAPQVWAWAPKRIFKIKKYVSKVLVVFRFEEPLYRKQDISVRWVGHPLVDLIEPRTERSSEPARRRTPVVALMPGSRRGELRMLLSIFLKTAERLTEKLRGVSFRLIEAPTIPGSFYERTLKSAKVPVERVRENAYDAIRSSDLAIACSGTATLECALLGTPMIVTNKGTLLTYVAAKSLIKVPYIGLPNLVLGKKRFPELLQYDATPEKLAREALKILTDEDTRNIMKKDLREVSEKLGEKGASRRAAEEILKTLSTSA
jgi:lipid-A-disaccharide synthase